MRSLLVICLLATTLAGTVWGSVKLMAREERSVKLMARERARKGEERREGVQGGKMVEALAGREVFFGRNFGSFLEKDLGTPPPPSKIDETPLGP